MEQRQRYETLQLAVEDNGRGILVPADQAIGHRHFVEVFGIGSDSQRLRIVSILGQVADQAERQVVVHIGKAGARERDGRRLVVELGGLAGHQVAELDPARATAPN